MTTPAPKQRIVFLVHYFPPINSAGGKRVEAMAKYFARSGREITVITTSKRPSDGSFTEAFPAAVTVLEIDGLGRLRPTTRPIAPENCGSAPNAAPTPGWVRKAKNWVMKWLGQLPDPRLPFATAMLSPLMTREVAQALGAADVVVGSCPPWPMLLAARWAGLRFGKPVVLDYRDHFSECHEMPGSALAKMVEKAFDTRLARGADQLVTVSQPMATYYGQFNPRTAVVINGYDHEIIDAVRAAARWQQRPAGKPLVMRYLGVITPDRVPRHLLEALAALHRHDPRKLEQLQLEYYGECSILAAALDADYPQLKPAFSFLAPVAYRKALELTVTADYLLFSETSFKKTLSAQGILTTKLFEYLAAGRPIVADIDPTMLAGQMILKAGIHHFVSNETKDFSAMLADPAFWQAPEPIDTEFVKTLSRAAQAREYLEILDAMGTPGSR
jgi:glycosyltransferase involved in cell wall biosynthesis